MTIVSLLPLCLALLAGFAAAWLLREREISMLRRATAEAGLRASETLERLSKAEQDASASRADLAVANERIASLQLQLSSEREAFQRDRVGVDEAVKNQFAALAQDVLDRTTHTFLELASTSLGEAREALTGTLSTRVEQIKGVLAPVQTEFAKFSDAVSSLQRRSTEDLASLKNSLEQVLQLQASLQDAVRTTNDTTGQLRNALQNPRIAGNWGELGLQRIVELAGMTEHCDFQLQERSRSADGSIEKPDLTVHLTGGLNIPVDAKTSTTNYIRAVAESDEVERNRLLRQSAQDLRARILELRARGYDRIEGYAGMTFMFINNESMLSSALAHDRSLIDDALHYKIVICSPLLLLCYLRAFAHGWRLQKQQENAEEVARRGKMLYDRLQSFFASLGKVGDSLSHTVKKYNETVAKMDNLLVPGREMGKMLGLAGDLKRVDSVEVSARDVSVKEGEALLAVPGAEA
jgi:DNA recombination protein RmuC